MTDTSYFLLNDSRDTQGHFQSKMAKRSADLIAKQCTPFCGSDCPFQDKHHDLIVSLLRLQDSKATSLENWKAFILHEAEKGANLNQPILDPDPDLRYPLLSWAAVLGKVKAVKWLLQQDFITFTENKGDFPPKLNVSNATALFSAVRNLHEGVRTRETYEITQLFASLLDAFIKRNPDILLVQEEPDKDTVLHLCARGEEDSTAPFLKYLRQIIRKLQEYHEKDNMKLPVKRILKRENAAGDSFLHLLTRSEEKEEAKKLIKFTEEKFPNFKFLKKVKTSEEMPVNEIDKAIRAYPEVYQTSSQETQSPLGSFRDEEDPFSEKSPTDEEEVIPLKELAQRIKPSSLSLVIDVSSSDQSSDGGEGCEVKEECTLLFQCDAGTGSQAGKIFPGTDQTQGANFDDSSQEAMPSRVSTNLVPGEMRYYSTSTHCTNRGFYPSFRTGENDDTNTTVTEACIEHEVEELPAQKERLSFKLETSPSSSRACRSAGDGETLAEARNVLLKLINETERKLEMKKEEVQKLQVEVHDIEENLNRYKESLTKLM